MAVMDSLTLFVALVFVLAGMVKGITGMGLPTVAVALLTLKMPPLDAAALLIVPTSLTNIWQLAAGPGLYPAWLRTRALLAAICVGAAASAALVASVDDGMQLRAAVLASVTLGVTLAGYGLLGLSGWRGHVAPGAQRWAGPLAGLATGVLAALTGVFVMPVAPYLQALDLDKDDLVQALGLAFMVSTLALAATLLWRGQWHAAAALGSVLALAPACIGMVLGQWLRQRMPAIVFRRCFFVCLLALGVHQCLRAVTA
jgi:uncharacterized membrane protein YfcA